MTIVWESPGPASGVISIGLPNGSRVDTLAEQGADLGHVANGEAGRGAWLSDAASVTTVSSTGLAERMALGGATGVGNDRGLSGHCVDIMASPVSQPAPVFPGAVGFGVPTPAGRRGEVTRVTNLDDTGPGFASGGASGNWSDLIFDVGGTITLSTKIVSASPLWFAPPANAYYYVRIITCLTFAALFFLAQTIAQLRNFKCAIPHGIVSHARTVALPPQ